LGKTFCKEEGDMTVANLLAFLKEMMEKGVVMLDTPVTLVVDDQEYAVSKLWTKHSHFTLEAGKRVDIED
jgi:hypothetical protein